MSKHIIVSQGFAAWWHHLSRVVRAQTRRLASVSALAALAAVGVAGHPIPAAAATTEQVSWQGNGSDNGRLTCNPQVTGSSAFHYTFDDGLASGSFPARLWGTGDVAYDGAGKVTSWHLVFTFFDVGSSLSFGSADLDTAGTTNTAGCVHQAIGPPFNCGIITYCFQDTATASARLIYSTNDGQTGNSSVTLNLSGKFGNQPDLSSTLSETFDGLVNTLVGKPTVSPLDENARTSGHPVTVMFTGVTTSGNTALSLKNTGPAAPGFSLGAPPTYYYVSTTAVFGSAVVCIRAVLTPGSRLLHFDAAGNINDVTAAGYPDLINGVICSTPLTSLSPFAIGTPVADITPPTTQASQSPAPNAQGWNNSDVLVNLSASDPDGVADVLEVDYSATGGQPIAATSVAGAVGSFTISGEGATQITYFAKDRAGNAEAAKTVTVMLDKTPPTVTYAGNAGSYTVDQTVSITCAAADPPNANGTAGSGLASTTCADVSAPAYTFNIGSNDLSATALDVAGNVGNGSTSFAVQVTSGSVCDLTTQFIESSAKFADLPFRHEHWVDVRVTMLCEAIAFASVSLDPEEKARLVARYQDATAELASQGWLTQAQAAILSSLAANL